MRAVFRVDGSTRMGTGHVIRCLTLAGILRERGHECLFVHRIQPGHMAGMIRNRGFPVYELSEIDPAPGNPGQEGHGHWLGVSPARDSQETRELLQELTTDLLVVDHYAIDSSWEAQLREKAPKILVIDDLADRPHDCDFLVDQTYGRQEREYRPLVPGNCEILTGAHYALLREEFASLREKALARRDRPNHGIERVLVSMGGSDPENVTERAIQGIVLSGQSVSIDVMLGGEAPHLKTLVKKWEAQPGIHFHVDTSDVARLMAIADIAVGAGGTTSWERCCMGLPTLSAIAAENQRVIVQSLASKGAVHNLDEVGKGFEARVSKSLNSFFEDSRRLHSMSLAARKVCDGHGAERIADRIAQSN
ncbi:UDP-2,4-diacetamido-2,4,6-trideoxy-beta-L-altropyranose hydrolase [Thiohalorhabdus methylotrophus]|uniref:UDP-2,4-diacetamido-2,4, 6-trideoxy-beta-L-altropyranose hydrolase n=1 Tax=Thiohalorhabdus methylotrophus TaxID=3242694 RepID=A0ABV4U139_9GAMM